VLSNREPKQLSWAVSADLHPQLHGLQPRLVPVESSTAQAGAWQSRTPSAICRLPTANTTRGQGGDPSARRSRPRFKTLDVLTSKPHRYIVVMDSSSTPLADYFWIAGVETITYQDVPQQTAQLDATIKEDGEGEREGRHSEENTAPTPNPGASGGSRANARHSRQNSANRLSKLSHDGRLSIYSLEEVEGTTRSNRSSATIRPTAHQSPGLGQENPGALPDFDFDKALFKFAVERENFLDDLSFSAGAKLHSRPPMVNPRAERIKAEEGGDAPGKRSPLRSIRGSIRGSIKGSIRRKMSFRDMSSMRKQPVTPRAGSAHFQLSQMNPLSRANQNSQRLSVLPSA